MVQNPVSLQCIRDKLREHKYPTRDIFLEDVDLIYTNARDYNGEQNTITIKAKELVEFIKEKVKRKSKIDSDEDKYVIRKYIHTVFESFFEEDFSECGAKNG